MNRRTILLAFPIAILAAAAVGGVFSAKRLENDALELAETGKAVIAVLDEQRAAITHFDFDRLLDSYAEGYHNPTQGRWTETLVSERDGLTVYEWRTVDQRPAGKSEIENQLADLVGRASDYDLVRHKLDRVEHGDRDEATVRTVLWLRGHRPDVEAITGRDLVFETFLSFRLDLVRADTGFEILRQELLDGHTVLGERGGFEEIAVEAGLDFLARRNPLFATEAWFPERFQILKYGAAGMTAADYDNDGWDDLFYADGTAARLYRNLGDGTFSDVTAETGFPTDFGGANVAIFADFDNDGDQDLFLGVFTAENRLFRNDTGEDGQVAFTDVTEGAGLGGTFVTVAAAGDADNDGLLDIYVGRYLDPRVALPDTLFYTRNGMGNSLLRNVGGLRFVDITEEAGVREGGLTLGVAWADYDRDGDQDLYVANDFGRNALLRNDGPGTAGEAVVFTDVSAATGAIDFGFGMSSSWGDVNNDGALDIYVSNVRSSQRWYGQATTLYQYLLNSLRQGTLREDLPLYREIYGFIGDDWRNFGDRMVKGNSLLLHTGDPKQTSFTDVSEDARANPFGWYWGANFFDYDNDGWLDIYAANGWISGKTSDDL